MRNIIEEAESASFKYSISELNQIIDNRILCAFWDDGGTPVFGCLEKVWLNRDGLVWFSTYDLHEELSFPYFKAFPNPAVDEFNSAFEGIHE